MDRIVLEGIEVWAHHGVLPDERANGQPFRIDVVLELDLEPAATSDQLDETVDYGALAQAVADAASGGPYDLIETVANEVLSVCLVDPRVTAAEVTVHKPKAPLPVAATDVRVTLRRERGP